MVYLLVRFTMPSSGFKVAVQSVDRDGDATRVNVALTYPGGPVLPVITPIRVVADVGANPGDKVELWIWEDNGNCVTAVPKYEAVFGESSDVPCFSLPP